MAYDSHVDMDLLVGLRLKKENKFKLNVDRAFEPPYRSLNGIAAGFNF